MLLNSCFNLNSYLYFITCLWNTVVVSFLAKFIAGCFELGKKNEAWFVPETLCSLRWCVVVLVCIQFSRSLVY